MLDRRALRVALARTGKSLKQISAETGIDLLRVYRITARSVQPHLDELEAMARCLGLDAGDLEKLDDKEQGE